MKYEVNLVPHKRDALDNVLEHLSGIINDRSIPESQKVNVNLQFKHLMKIKMATMQPQGILLKTKAGEKSDETSDN